MVNRFYLGGIVYPSFLLRPLCLLFDGKISHSQEPISLIAIRQFFTRYLCYPGPPVASFIPTLQYENNKKILAFLHNIRPVLTFTGMYVLKLGKN